MSTPLWPGVISPRSGAGMGAEGICRRALCLLVSLCLILGAAWPTEAARAKAVSKKAKKAAKKREVPGPVIKSAVVTDMASGRVLYALEPDLAIPPASVAKIMTLYLVYEAVELGKARWSDPVPVSVKAWRTGGTKMFLDPHTTVPLGELVMGIAVVSANDAAVAVAEYLGGSVENFVLRMNEKARQLGMTHTVFKNPHGLPAKGQITTARDMATLSRAYLDRFPESLRVHSQRYYTYHNIRQRNRNRLLGTYPGADGIKTGFVCKAGYNIAATARRGDTRLLAVVMGARNPVVRAKETARLLDEGFRMMGARGG